MNIEEDMEPIVAKSYGDSNHEGITYTFSESYAISRDKKAILAAEIRACEKLLSQTTNKTEQKIVLQEITDLKMALDLLT